MRYTVLVTPEAEANLTEAFNYIFDRSPQGAVAWAERVQRRIQTLERFPERCAIAPESDFHGTEIREILESPYRILFRIEGKPKIVRVLHIRHAARKFFGEAEDE